MVSFNIVKFSSLKGEIPLINVSTYLKSDQLQGHEGHGGEANPGEHEERDDPDFEMTPEDACDPRHDEGDEAAAHVAGHGQPRHPHRVEAVLIAAHKAHFWEEVGQDGQPKP